MGFFFGAQRAGLVLVGIIEARFLIYFATSLDNRDLAARLDVDCGLNKAHRVHVFDFAAGAEMREILRCPILLILAGTTNTDVYIGAQVAVLHIAVTSAQIAQN